MKTWWRRCHKRWVVLKQPRSPAEWWLFVCVLGFAAAVPLLMRLRLPTLGRLLEHRCAVPVAHRNLDEASARIIRTVESVLAIGAPLISPRCLTRGLTLYYFLRRAGVELSLCFGAGYGKAGFSGHCWLVKDGEPFLERGNPQSHFATMYRLPEGAARSLTPVLNP